MRLCFTVLKDKKVIYLYFKKILKKIFFTLFN